jgi:hypothetical protein
LNPAWAVATAAVFIWFGMVLAISFLEAPLKFRAPGVTLQIGLGIGRLVFTALNRVEGLLGLVALAALAVKVPPGGVVIAILVPVLALAFQMLAVRRWLNRRSDQVLSGAEGPRSRGHYAYIGLEVVKAAGLLVTGILLFASDHMVHMV